MGDRTFLFGANNMPGCRVWRLEHLSSGQQFLWPTRLVGGMDEWVICSAESHVNREAKGTLGIAGNPVAVRQVPQTMEESTWGAKGRALCFCKRLFTSL